MEFEIYRNAPIIEAALDVRVRTSEDVDFRTLAAIRDSNYPETSSEPFKLHVKLEWGDKPSDESRQDLGAPLGYFLRSPDQKQIVQIRRDGFTFNRLAPYHDWQSFGGEARRLWDIYRERIPIQTIEALSLTYMNEILVPFTERIEDYLNAYIHLPEKLPQEATSFSLSIQQKLPDNQGSLHLAEGIGPHRRDGFVTIGLFVQAVKFLEVAAEDMEEAEIWTTFEALREAKSKAFEACITDKVREAIR